MLFSIKFGLFFIFFIFSAILIWVILLCLGLLVTQIYTSKLYIQAMECTIVTVIHWSQLETNFHAKIFGEGGHGTRGQFGRQNSIEDAKQFSCSKCGQLLMGISTFMGSTHEMDEKTQSFFFVIQLVNITFTAVCSTILERRKYTCMVKYDIVVRMGTG